VELLGYGKVKYERTKEALVVTLPDKLNNIMPVLKIKK
jgi:alpha-L-fucosidase